MFLVLFLFLKIISNDPYQVLHDRKFQEDHDTAFSVIVKYVPELQTKMFLAISDEFTKVVAIEYKKV